MFFPFTLRLQRAPIRAPDSRANGTSVEKTESHGPYLQRHPHCDQTPDGKSIACPVRFSPHRANCTCTCLVGRVLSATPALTGWQPDATKRPVQQRPGCEVCALFEQHRQHQQPSVPGFPADEELVPWPDLTIELGCRGPVRDSRSTGFWRNPTGSQRWKKFSPISFLKCSEKRLNCIRKLGAPTELLPRLRCVHIKVRFLSFLAREAQNSCCSPTATDTPVQPCGSFDHDVSGRTEKQRKFISDKSPAMLFCDFLLWERLILITLNFNSARSTICPAALYIKKLLESSRGEGESWSWGWTFLFLFLAVWGWKRS